MLIKYLLFISAVMGIEFAYAAETAFVSPTLLGIGIQHRNMVHYSELIYLTLKQKSCFFIILFKTDAHLVSESNDRLLPHAATGFVERSMPFSAGTPQTLHHPLIYWHHTR
jgi:hypothetical protein